jgi:hypothetical protein
MSGGWDRTVRLWDPRSRTATSEHAQADKVRGLSAVAHSHGSRVQVYTMALADNRLVVGMVRP